jgi:hypothetical protein
MPQSVRISDRIYELAAREAEQMDRSLAQQIEHWIKLGVALEISRGTTLADVRAAAVKVRRALDEQSIRSGRRKPDALFAFSTDTARAARVVAPKGAFSEFDRRR